MLKIKILDLVLAVVLFVFLLAVSACAQPVDVEPAGPDGPPVDQSQATPGSTPTPVELIEISSASFSALVESLRQSGAVVEPVGTIDANFFPVGGQIINVDGQRVEVYEFANEEQRTHSSNFISKSGFQVGNAMIDWTDQPNFWAKGSLIVLYVGKDEATIERLSEHIGEPVTRHFSEPVFYPEAVLASLSALSSETGTAQEQIEVLGYEFVQWPDSCLGMSSPHTLCAQVITPGYRVMLSLEGETYIYHTNETGSQVIKGRR
jgi:hypothetical protein